MRSVIISVLENTHKIYSRYNLLNLVRRQMHQENIRFASWARTVTMIDRRCRFI